MARNSLSTKVARRALFPGAKRTRFFKDHHVRIQRTSERVIFDWTPPDAKLLRLEIPVPTRRNLSPLYSESRFEDSLDNAHVYSQRFFTSDDYGSVVLARTAISLPIDRRVRRSHSNAWISITTFRLRSPSRGGLVPEAKFEVFLLTGEVTRVDDWPKSHQQMEGFEGLLNEVRKFVILAECGHRMYGA